MVVIEGLGMSDISDLEQRLAAALRRISIATEFLPKASAIGAVLSSSAPAAATSESLDVAELAEIRSKLNSATTKIIEQEENIVALTQALGLAQENHGLATPAEDTPSNLLVDAISVLEVELSRLTQSNTQLRQSNQGLRDANSKGLGDAGLINSGLQSEIDILNAERTADKAQLHILLTALRDAASINMTEKKENA